MILSQLAYLYTKGNNVDSKLEKRITKLDPYRELDDDKNNQQRTAAGYLAWVATGTSPRSVCLANMALQGKTKTIALLCACQNAYAKLSGENLSSHRYVPLAFESIHMRVFSDGSFQNLPENHLKVGFVFTFADKYNDSNIFHWHSGHASRCPASTKKAELLPLNTALQRFQNQRMVAFQLSQKEVPVAH